MLTYPFENRMAVEGQRLYEERYGPLEDDYDDVRTLCDIMDSCSDCPRMGDDCDGKDLEEDPDDRIAYYERQGDDIVYFDENDCEVYREQA